MKILMISTDERLLEALSDVYARHVGYARNLEEMHIVVFTKERPGLPPLNVPKEKNLFVYATDSRNKLFCAFDAVKIARVIINERGFRAHDSLITTQDPFLTAMAGSRLRLTFGIPLEIQVHTDIGSPYFRSENILNKIRLFLARRYLPKADKIRVVSERIKRFLIQDSRFKIQDSRIEVRPIVVDLGKIKNAPIITDLHVKYQQWKKIVLMASRLTKEKDMKTAITAFKETVSKLPDTGLVIVGNGPEKSRLKFQASRLKLHNSVVFEDWIDQETLFSYYKTADVFLSTSLYEGYGLSMAEAHAAGCPIVATDAGIASEVTPHICPVGDSVCLAQKLLNILA